MTVKEDFGISIQFEHEKKIGAFQAADLAAWEVRRLLGLYWEQDLSVGADQVRKSFKQLFSRVKYDHAAFKESTLRGLCAEFGISPRALANRVNP